MPTAGLYVTYANVAVYAGAFMAQQPVLPYLMESLGASTAQFGLLQTFFSAIQFVGTLISGPLLDKYGGRPLMLVSLLASALCYSMTAMSTSLTILYLSRVPVVFQHAMLAARTIVTESSTEQERAAALSYVGVAYGIGFGLGPLLGGLMTRVSLTATSWVAAILSLLGYISIQVTAPTTRVPGPVTSPSEKEGSPESKTSFQHFFHLLTLPDVGHLLVTKILGQLAMAVFSTMYTVLLKDAGLGPEVNGAALSFIGVITIAAQALLVGPCARRVGEARSVYLCILLLIACYLILAASKSLLMMMLILLPLCSSAVVFQSITASMLTKAAPLTRRGTILSLDMGIGSAVRTLSPSMGGWVMSVFGSPGIGLASAALVSILLLLMQIGAIKIRDVSRPYKQELEELNEKVQKEDEKKKQ